LAPATLVGCSYFGPPADGAGDVSSNDLPGGCEGLAMIETGDDGDSQTLPNEGRGGYLYTFVDDVGSTVTPSSSGFVPAKDGAHGSRGALRVHGKLAAGADVYAGLGLSFVDPKRGYDASRYRGISFLAKHAPGSVATLRFAVPDKNTDKDGGQCTECYNDFGVEFQLRDNWTRYEVDFADLKQESGWGDPRPKQLATEALYGIQWKVSKPEAAFDVWIDDVTFIGCP